MNFETNIDIRIQLKEAIEVFGESEPTSREVAWAAMNNLCKVLYIVEREMFEAYATLWSDNDFQFLVSKTAWTEHDINIIVKGKKGAAKTVECSGLQKANIDKKEMIERIQVKFSCYSKEKSKITDLLTLNSEFLLVKGTLFYDVEHPYFGIMLQNDGTLLLEEFKELLRVLLIDGKYYFVTWWQEPECGKRGVIIYRLKNNVLVEVFTDRSKST